jgi:hypothetical protein
VNGKIETIIKQAITSNPITMERSLSSDIFRALNTRQTVS